ncbi:MAG: hypothetical protein IJL70_06365 [Treponema sp.]|nr:hypothetical protein [Treponema sp.]
MSKRFCFFIISIIVFCLAIGILFASFFGSNIEVSKILSYFESLSSISSILLGVMGVWLSLIWNKDGENKKENIIYIKVSLMVSLCIITTFLIFRQSYPIFIQIDLFKEPENKALIRIISFFISIEATLFTIISVVLVVFSFDFFSFDNDVQKKINEYSHEKKSKLFSLSQNNEVENDR